MITTPFIFGKVAKEYEFTNRTKDVEYLSNNFRGVINTMIISPRRWGKTSLVNFVADEFKKDEKYFVCKLDVFNCRTPEQFFASFANAILTASASNWDELVAGARKYLSRFLPNISLSDSGQTYELTFGVDFKSEKLSIDEILDLPYRIATEKEKQFIVCIDEFQNISNYDDSLGFQQKLRAHWQYHNNVCYCLYGSKRHMLLNIFNDYQMPFYKFGYIHFLDKISRPDWVLFIGKRFQDTGKYIPEELCGMIADKVKNHPYYAQQLSQQVWLRTEHTATEEIVIESFDSLIRQLSLLFTNIIDSLTAKQISFLVAVAKGESNFSSKKVLDTYQLGTSANIKNLKKVALDRDIIDIFTENKIEFQDPVFEYWILHYYL